LEGIKRKYFNTLGDSVDFNKFFNLFSWYNSKISDAIRQLLPAKVKFVGGEYAIQSHLLERPKYQHQYAVFHTAITLPNATLINRFTMSCSSYNTSIVGDVIPHGR
jgi:hypothetical protein